MQRVFPLDTSDYVGWGIAALLLPVWLPLYLLGRLFCRLWGISNNI